MKKNTFTLAIFVFLFCQLTQGQQKVTIDYGKELLPKLTIKRGNMFRAEVNNEAMRDGIAAYVEQGYPLYLGHRNYNEPSSMAGSCGKPAEFYKENGTIKYRLNENMTALRAFAKTQNIQVFQQFNRVPLSGNFKDEKVEGEFDIFTFQEGWYKDGIVAKGRPDGLLPIKEQYEIFANVVSKYIIACDSAAGINSIWTGFDEPAHTMGFKANQYNDAAKEENVRRYVEFFAPLAIKLKKAGKTIGGIQLNAANAGQGLYEIAMSELKKRNAYIDYFTIQNYQGGDNNESVISHARAALNDPYWAKTKVFFNRYGYWGGMENDVDPNNLRNTSREMVLFLNAEKIIVDNADIMYGYAIEADVFADSKDKMLGQIGMFLNKMPQKRNPMTFENANMDGFSSANNSELMSIVWNKSGTQNFNDFKLEFSNLPNDLGVLSIRKGSGTVLSNVASFQWDNKNNIISGIDLKPYEFLLITIKKDASAPSVPTELVVSAVTQTSLTLSWTASNDNVGVTGYDILEGTTVVKSVTSTSASITGLNCNTSHTYTVKAKDAAGNKSASSAGKSITTSACTSSNITTRIEAENYSGMSGIITQTTSDVGSGLNIANINNNDYIDYAFNVAKTGTYTTKFRVSSASNGGTISVLKGTSVLGSVNVAVTGGWQTWTTINGPSINLTSTGAQTLRLKFVNANTTGYLMNLNWWECAGVGEVKSALVDLTEQITQESSFEIFPNPASEKVSLNLNGFSEKSVIEIFNMQGELIYSVTSEPTLLEIPVMNWLSGLYFVKVKSLNILITNKLIIK